MKSSDVSSPSLPIYMLDRALSIALVGVLILHYFRVTGLYDIWLLGAATVVGTAPVFWSAFKAIRAREWASMDMLASIALLFSILGREWSSAVFIALMLAAARILEELTERRTEASIKGLLDLRPETAKVERDGKILDVAPSAIQPGDIVVVDIG
ncbi:MAG: hypothetical protein AAB883_02965, partial [Patescibacteria group bacterium]